MTPNDHATTRATISAIENSHAVTRTPKSIAWSWFLLASIALGYFVLWASANWPALAHPWWASDDYGIGMQYDWLHNWKMNGRPLQNLPQMLLQWETGSNGWMVNMLLRLAQGLIHCTAASLIALLCARHVSLWVTLPAVAVFVIWPFNGEAVLWRSAGAMPIAALLGVIGVGWIESAFAETDRRWLAWAGAAAIVAATLCHQLAAIAGLMVWVLLFTLNEGRSKGSRNELLTIAAAYSAGAALSLGMMHWLGGVSQRSSLASDISAKFLHFQTLAVNFLEQPDYDLTGAAAPNLVLTLHRILAWTLLALAYASLLRRRWPLPRRLTYALAVSSLFILPYAPLLITAEFTTSARVYYVAPLVLAAVLMLLERMFGRWWFVQPLVVSIACILLGRYFWLARLNAQDFVNIYQGDVNSLVQIVNFAASQPSQPHTVVVAQPPDYLRSYDPYPVHFSNGDGKASALLVPWAVGPFIEWRSQLHAEQTPEHLATCATWCRLEARGRPLAMSLLPSTDVVCVCP